MPEMKIVLARGERNFKFARFAFNEKRLYRMHANTFKYFVGQGVVSQASPADPDEPILDLATDKFQDAFLAVLTNDHVGTVPEAVVPVVARPPTPEKLAAKAAAGPKGRKPAAH